MEEKPEGASFDFSGDEASLQNLLGVAIRAEVEAAETYRKLLDRELPESTREKVERLVRQEEEHEEKFGSIFEDFFPEEAVDLPEESKVEVEVDIDDGTSVEELFEIALENELESEEFYSDLRDQFEDEEIRSMLGYLAANEREHYEILSEERKKLE